MSRVVIIGAGHNALVTALVLARGGLAPLVLERREVVGGCLISDEICSGFRCPTLSHGIGPLVPEIARELDLPKQGLQSLSPSAQLCALNPDGPALILENRTVRSLEDGRHLVAKDVQQYRAFAETVDGLSQVIGPLVRQAAPRLEDAGARELFELLATGRRFRGLGRRNAFRLLQWGPMPIADLVTEWFDDPLLRASVAARGIFGRFAGPRSAGTAGELLLQSTLTGGIIAPSAMVRGGPGALTSALARAAQERGATIRTNAQVSRIVVKDGAVTGIQLESGEEIATQTVVSGADPKLTFLSLVDPVHLEPDFVQRIQCFRAMGVTAKLNFALDALPRFKGLDSLPAEDVKRALSGRIHVGPSLEYLERAFDQAKYGELSPRPYLDITIPSLVDSSLAPEGRHVMSVYMQYAPYASRTPWASSRSALERAVLETLNEYAPGLSNLVIDRQVITPDDLERVYGLSGGHIHHGEHAFDQMLMLRPALGWGRYQMPIRGLYLCGAGTHPGGGTTGACGTLAGRQILSDLGNR